MTIYKCFEIHKSSVYPFSVYPFSVYPFSVYPFSVYSFSVILRPPSVPSLYTLSMSSSDPQGIRWRRERLEARMIKRRRLRWWRALTGSRRVAHPLLINRPFKSMTEALVLPFCREMFWVFRRYPIQGSIAFSVRAVDTMATRCTHTRKFNAGAL